MVLGLKIAESKVPAEDCKGCVPSVLHEIVLAKPPCAPEYHDHFDLFAKQNLQQFAKIFCKAQE